MIPEEDTEGKDDFVDFYHQFRNNNGSSFNQLKRSSYSHPRTSYCSSESGTISSEYPSGQTVRKRFSLPRSKSFGRDPRLTDLMNAYHAPAEHDETGSRDSGNCSAGTPELGWRGRDITRVNSFPQSTQRTSDTMSLHGAQSDHSMHGTGYLDTVSLHSLDSHLRNWSPLAEELRPKLSAKRKYSTFDEAISDDDEMVAKRPRTPEKYNVVQTHNERYQLISFLKKP